MTETEKRDNAVKEMEEVCFGSGHATELVPPIAKYCFYTLYNACYRKTEEVQKETAQKFLQLWYDDMFNAGECVGHIEKLAKEMGIKIDVFGAEVEE